MILPGQVTNITHVAFVTGTPLRSNPLYVTYYIFWSKFIFVEVIPYFTILILNSLIIGKIWKSNQFRKRFVVRIFRLLTLKVLDSDLYFTRYNYRKIGQSRRRTTYAERAFIYQVRSAVASYRL